MNVPAVSGEASDLEAQEPDLRAALAGFLDHHVRELGTALGEIEARANGSVPLGTNDSLEAHREHYRVLADHIRFSIRAINDALHDPPPMPAELPAEQVSWYAISTVAARDEAAGRALWERVKAHARDELASGRRGATAVEQLHRDPLDRARYLAVREALADGLLPRNGMEWLLLDGMAAAWNMHLHWLGKHVLTEGLDAEGLRRDVKSSGEWQPPRLRNSEAVDRAAVMADKFQRQFLRLMKCYRDGRRLIASMTVLGGQVNVAEQQVVTSGATLPERP